MALDWPVAVLTASMDTFGIRPPEGSKTCPLRVQRNSWAKEIPDVKTAMRKKIERSLTKRFMASLFQTFKNLK